MPSFLEKVLNMSLRKKESSRIVWACLILANFLFFPFDAVAANTFGAIICNMRDPAGAFPGLLSAIAYIVGVFLILRGVLLLKKSSDSGGQTSPLMGVAHLIGGALLLALPAATSMLQDTFFTALAGSSASCHEGPVAGATSLDVMMQNFVKNVHNPMFWLLSALGYIVGAAFIFTGILRMAKAGTDPRAANPKDIIVLLVSGSILMSVSSMLPVMLSTLFGGGGGITSFPGIDWSGIVGGADTTAADNTIQAILAFIQIVGGISFLRGWMLIKKAAEGGQATIPQGVTHIIGGAMAINIGAMLKIIDNTFGTGLIKP